MKLTSMNASAKYSSIHTIPPVIEEALKQGIPQNVIEAAQRSPVYKMAMDWKLALPLHPEYRTLPMVWYVPPLSPIQSYADAGGLPKSEGVLPAIESLRIPVQYLANMLSAGDTGPVLRALKRMMAMRHYMRSQTVEGVTDTRAIDEVGLSVAQVEEMYRYLAIANYEDRFVISNQSSGNGGRCLSQNAMAAVLPLATVATARTANSTCSTVAVSMPSTSPKYATKRRANNADPQVIGLLMEYPDELLWECKEDALALIRRDAPMLTDFTRNLLNAPLLDKQADGAKCLTVDVPHRCCCSNMFMPSPAIAARQWFDLLAEYEKVGLQLDCRELPDYLPLYLGVLKRTAGRSGERRLAQRCADPRPAWRTLKTTRGTVVRVI
ncbi:Respiratory nitrate reductase 2 beta chain [Escherichia coli]|uniref:Respiratory nitrate reductase 2 beta chain n=1 Tax=Escherichia coli TaxID=562 RepID=A0A376VI46_ECOLX|nr:Respiratory nitrate reductase 2 beta chain [Escherichia coli]